MKTSKCNQDSPKTLLRTFYVGSTLVLLACALFSGLYVAINFVHLENERAGIALEQLTHAVEYEINTITEETFTKAFEAIDWQVREMAKQVGSQQYSFFLVDPSGACFYHQPSKNSDVPCSLSVAQSERIAKLSQNVNANHPAVEFDAELNQYVVLVNLSLASSSLGQMYLELPDGYGFYRGRTAAFTIKSIAIPFLCCLMLWLGWLAFSRRALLKKHLNIVLEMEKKRALGEQAANVVHNIRAPIEAIKAAFSSGLPKTSEEVHMARAAALRIEDIADDLLKKYRGEPAEYLALTAVAYVLMNIIKEAKPIMDSKKITLEYHFDETIWNSSVAIPQSALSQVISNLFSNSQEAMDVSLEARLSIAAKASDNSVLIVVSDTGCGIPESILLKLKTEAVTHGKKNGTGLGFKYIRETVKSVNGHVEIRSKVGEGTTVLLEIPLIPSAPLLLNPLTIDSAKNFVVIDDDEEIHKIWRERLKGVRVVSFYSGKALTIGALPRDVSLYAVDYDLGETEPKGTELIARLGLQNQAFVETYQYDDPVVQEACQKMGVKLLPKPVISVFPINISESTDTDLVLIDDDPLVHSIWKVGSKRRGKRILIAKDEMEFRSFSVAPEVPVFVDKNLASNISGIELAQRLHLEGFKRVYLTTGDELEETDDFSFLAGVQGKEFPKTLN